MQLQCSWTLLNYSKHNVVSSLMISVDLLCLQVAKIPRFQDLVIFANKTEPISLSLAAHAIFVCTQDVI